MFIFQPYLDGSERESTFGPHPLRKAFRFFSSVNHVFVTNFSTNIIPRLSNIDWANICMSNTKC